jgi:hypothetical protein
VRAGWLARTARKGFAISPRRVPFGPVPVERITELETQLATALASVAALTLANAGLTESLANAELSLKRSRRNARQDGNTLRDEISVLQKRRA